MRLKTQIELDSVFWRNLHLLQVTLGVSDKHVARSLGLNIQKLEFLRNNSQAINSKELHFLLKNFGIKEDYFWNADNSPTKVKNNFKSHLTASIPEQYKVGFGSKSFTVRHILKLAEKYNLLPEISTYFKHNELLFSNSIDFEISVEFASDILDFIASKVDITIEDYQHISSANTFYFKNSELGKSLTTCHSPLSVFELFLAETAIIEENWSYKIERANLNKIVVNSYPKEKMMDHYKKKNFSSYNFSKFRTCMAANLPLYAGFVGTKPSISKSVHYGNDYCQFVFDISDIKQLSA